MKLFLLNPKITLKFQIVASISMFTLLFTQFFAYGMLIFIVATSWNVYTCIIRPRLQYVSTAQVFNHHFDQIDQFKEKRQWFRWSVYMSVIPMVVIGIATIIIMLISVFTLF